MIFFILQVHSPFGPKCIGQMGEMSSPITMSIRGTPAKESDLYATNILVNRGFLTRLR